MNIGESRTADNSRYWRRKEQETADNAKMLQAEFNDQGADNTTSVYLEGFANGITCYGNPYMSCRACGAQKYICVLQVRARQGKPNLDGNGNQTHSQR
jgi:hypothetical protein